MALISVEEALARILAAVSAPVPSEPVPLQSALGRTLSADLAATRTQPPFAASAMDGYALRAEDAARAGAVLDVIGASVAGRRFCGVVQPGQAVRIFTGAPIPEGADAILIQEDAARDGQRLTVGEPVQPGRYIRPSGLDFHEGDTLLQAGQRLDAVGLAMAAAMGLPVLPVRRRPRVAILATGDELVRPGEAAGPDQIVASNPFALAALVERGGGEPLDLGIAGDTIADLRAAFAQARSERADVIVTLGGASVGEHDLVQEAMAQEGLQLGFWRVALRPGKPLMHGRIGPMLLLGLPGNPVSSIVCGILFVVPLIRRLLGDAQAGADPGEAARLATALPANDSRQDYLRAGLELDSEGWLRASAHPRQDSSMLGLLARSQALIVRAPHAPAAKAGDPCRIIRLDRFC